MEIIEMLRSVIRLIFKTTSVTPDFFDVSNMILSFLTRSQSFKKICTWEIWAQTSFNKETYHAIHWILIYLVDRIIHLLNNPNKGNK